MAFNTEPVEGGTHVDLALGGHVEERKVDLNEKKNELQLKEPKEYKFGSETKWSKKLAYLELVLWSGSFILAGEHLLHGEVSPYPPFLTAAGEGPEAVREMLIEMGTVGVTMLVALVAAWAVGVFLVDFFNYKKHKKASGQIEAK